MALRLSPLRGSPCFLLGDYAWLVAIENSVTTHSSLSIPQVRQPATNLPLSSHRGDQPRVVAVYMACPAIPESAEKRGLCASRVKPRLFEKRRGLEKRLKPLLMKKGLAMLDSPPDKEGSWGCWTSPPDKEGSWGCWTPPPDKEGNGGCWTPPPDKEDLLGIF